MDSDPERVLEAFNATPLITNLACGQYLTEQGIDLSQYSTHNSVRDGVALMDALDCPTYNLYGISYGATLTQEIMRYYDENAEATLPAVRSVLIDGVMPLSVDSCLNGAMVGAQVVTESAPAGCVCRRGFSRSGIRRRADRQCGTDEIQCSDRH